MVRRMLYKIIAVRIDKQTLEQIEKFIKKEYPRTKTVSEVVRLALRKFLESNNHN